VLNKWLKNATSHPIGVGALGTIIGGIILAVLGWLWSNSNFSMNGALIWSGAKTDLRSVISWFTAPVTVSRLALWIVICIGATGWLVAVGARLRLSQFATKTAVKEHVRDTLVTALQVPVQKPELLVSTLTYTQRLMFHALFLQYPGAANLSSLGGLLGLNYPAAEKLFEEMSETGLIEMNNVMDLRSNRTQPMVRLTKDGRDYCLENQLDTQPSP